MKNTYHFVIGITLALLISSCDPAPSHRGIVEFSSPPESSWMSYANFMPSAPDEQGSFALYLTGPALLFGGSQEGNESLHLYLPEDGNRVDLRLDGGILFANDIPRTIVVNTNNQETFKAWFKEADIAALKSLRLIEIDDKNVDDSINDAFKTIQSVNPHVLDFSEDDFLISADGSSPLILMIDSSEDDDDMDYPLVLQDMDLSETQILLACEIDDATLQILKLKGMPKLQKIIICDSPPDALLGTFPHVRSVTLMETDKPQNLSLMTNLEALHLLENDYPINLGDLPHPEMLRALTIGLSTNVVGLEKLTNLEYLNPGEGAFTNEELTALLNSHPNLVCLDLLHADLQSLEPLRQARKLEVISFGDFLKEQNIDFSPLSDLSGLNDIGLSEDARKPEVIAAIRKACPQVVIYRHDKLCLGSGWLIIFIPALLILLLLKQHQSKVRKGA